MPATKKTYPGKLADPEFRLARAKKAAAVRLSLDNYVRHVVERAPDLTPEHAAQLRAVLPPVPADAADSTENAA